VERSLGQGGEGTVYLARDELLDRPVAVKLIAPNGLGQGGWRERLLAEARNVGRLQHPNVVTLHDVGEHEGHPFLVFEYVEGRSLATLVREEGPLPVDRVTHLMRQVLAGVAHAHARAVAHLDLKPGNILVTPNDTARVTDFGTSCLVGRSRQDRVVHGTPHYLSPEQVGGSELGPATDVFALGIVFHELLTHRRLFSGPSLEAIAARVVARPVPAPSRWCPDLDPRLEAVVLRALERDPQRRYPDAGAMGVALDEAIRPVAGTSVAPGGARLHTLEFLLLRMRHKGDFPALSRTLAEINRLTADEAKASATQLANVVLRDYALTERLLRLANSAFYGSLARPVRTVSEAVRVLGFRQVRVAASGIVYGRHFGLASSPQARDAVVSAFLSALMARHLAQGARSRAVEDAFIAGLFHNLGRHLALFYFAEEYAEIQRRRREQGLDWETAAISVLELPLHELGAAVARSWRFPETLVRAMLPIAESESEEGNRAPSEEERLHRLACLTNAACDRLEDLPPEALEEALERLAARYTDLLPAGGASLPVLIEAAVRKIGEFGPVIGFAPERSRVVQQAHAWFAARAAPRQNASAPPEDAPAVPPDAAARPAPVPPRRRAGWLARLLRWLGLGRRSRGPR
jgi:HD-like signal output (HDOD) protein/tRNA A-37 threonylcarbamoyl transferase component Bud32